MKGRSNRCDCAKQMLVECGLARAVPASLFQETKIAVGYCAIVRRSEAPRNSR
jgi:hypothetical protein